MRATTSGSSHTECVEWNICGSRASFTAVLPWSAARTRTLARQKSVCQDKAMAPHRSGRRAGGARPAQLPSLGLRGAPEDPVVEAVVERVVEALGAHGAARAD